MMRRFRFALTLTLLLGFGLACAGNRSADIDAASDVELIKVGAEHEAAALNPMAPFLGAWRVNYDVSYGFVISHHDTNDVKPGAYSDYIAKFGGLIKMVIADSAVTYERGRHHAVMPISEIVKTEAGVDLEVEMNADQIYQWQVFLDEEGFLHVLSSRPNFKEIFIYERTSADWEPPPMPPRPPGRPAAGQR